jgi:ATP-dependent Lon protease
MTEDETRQAQMASDASPESPGRLEIPDALPVLPLRGGTVVFPLAVTPLSVGLDRSIRMVGTAAIIHQLMRAPDGTVRLIVQGLERIRLLDFVTTEPYLVARVAAAPDRMSPGFETEGLRRAVLDLFRRLVALIPEVPDEVAAAAETVTDPRQVAYLVASTGLLDGAARQQILELSRSRRSCGG